MNGLNWPKTFGDTIISHQPIGPINLSTTHIFFHRQPAHPPLVLKVRIPILNNLPKTSTMTTPSIKLLGKGSLCSVLLKKLHPADRVATHFPNAIATQQLTDLVAVRQDMAHRASSRSVKIAIFFMSLSLGDDKFWASKHFVKVLTSCPDDKVFAPPSPAAARANQNPNNTPVNLDNVTRTNDLDEDIARFLALNIHVDEDHEPAPKNLPLAAATTDRDSTTDLYIGQSWGRDGNCH